MRKTKEKNAKEISFFEKRSDRKFNISKVRYVKNLSAFLGALICTFKNVSVLLNNLVNIGYDDNNNNDNFIMDKNYKRVRKDDSIF